MRSLMRLLPWLFFLFSKGYNLVSDKKPFALSMSDVLDLLGRPVSHHPYLDFCRGSCSGRVDIPDPCDVANANLPQYGIFHR